MNISKTKELSDEQVAQCLQHITGIKGRPDCFSNVHMYYNPPKNDWDAWENQKFLEDEKRCNAFFSSVCSFVRRQLKLLEKRQTDHSYCMKKIGNKRKKWTYSGKLIEKFFNDHCRHGNIWKEEEEPELIKEDDHIEKTLPKEQKHQSNNFSYVTIGTFALCLCVTIFFCMK